MAYDPALPQNGVSVNVGTTIGVPYTRFGTPQVGGYALPGSQWVPSYMMAQPMAPVDDQVRALYFFHQTNDIFIVFSNVRLKIQKLMNYTLSTFKTFSLTLEGFMMNR